jgi:hypothetical protein
MCICTTPCPSPLHDTSARSCTLCHHLLLMRTSSMHMTACMSRITPHPRPPHNASAHSCALHHHLMLRRTGSMHMTACRSHTMPHPRPPHDTSACSCALRHHLPPMMTNSLHMTACRSHMTPRPCPFLPNKAPLSLSTISFSSPEPPGHATGRCPSLLHLSIFLLTIRTHFLALYSGKAWHFTLLWCATAPQVLSLPDT